MTLSNDLPKKILIVDQDQNVANKILGPLDKMGVSVVVANDLHTAKYRFNKEFFRVVFVSSKFENHDALDLIQAWRNHEVVEKRYAGFIVLNQYEMQKEKKALMEELSGIRVLTKPLSLGETLTAIKGALQYCVSKENKEILYLKIYEPLEKGKLTAEQAISLTNKHKEHLGDSYYPLIVSLYESVNNLKAAIEILEKADGNSIDYLKLLNLKGEVHLKLGNHEAAKGCFVEADKIAPSNLNRIEKMVDVFLELQDPDSAVKKQKELLAMDIEDGSSKFDMFDKLESYGYSDQSIAFCREASNPAEVVKYFNNKGVMLSQSGRRGDAIAEYERAVIYFPKNKRNYLIHYNKALALVKTKEKANLKKALVEIDKALSFKSNFFKAYDLKDKIEAILKTSEKHRAPQG